MKSPRSEYFLRKWSTAEELSSGEVGYIIAGIKSVTDTKIGDTIIDPENPVQAPCPGYKDIKPMVFCGFYPTLTSIRKSQGCTE